MSLATILVVDDERNIRRALRMVLEGAGYQVLVAETGEDALDMRKAMRRDTKKRSVVKAKKFEQKPWEIEWH